ncbi:glycosyltransferase [Halogeometricum borinquense DSM 11551]|uniref:Glycosyltransferase n=1 Tax=Halogeometricum borinquense (strain ATCC 700274 / DSM 11551 / JCM 10706 / KCTC 4070 / PR3) TaxID=469382 RepID=E4NUH4_HALBP|nr:glycosyltransferase family 4 protein [Halogeometricum borinquense]ADQ68694.1 glycosyltransferase [Halogeometricum borinquense DSM 11551]ELY25434.1 glycosyltransferase [Halogeometricum borinquense DSM 11551]
MEILVISREFPPYVLGGISYHLKNLYNEIQNLGHNVTVLAGKCPQSWNELEKEVDPNINVIPVEFGYRKGYYLLYPVSLWSKLVRLDTSKYDIAITHTPLPFKIPHLNLITKYHDCVTETRPYIRDGLSTFGKIGDSFLHPIRKRIDQTSLHKSDKGIFVSELNKNAWEKHYEAQLETDVIYNGVDVDKFYPTSRDGDYVLFVGSSERKGISKVLKYAESGEYTVHIVGDTEVENNNIITHGRVSQEKLRELYSGALATIHPTKFEAFGNIVLESLSCGTPVITTNKCGAGEVLTEETGIITNKISEGLERIESTKEQECRKVAENYSWNKVADKTISLINETI